MSQNSQLNLPIVTTTSEFKQFITTPPSFEDAFKFIRNLYDESLTEPFVREWYEYMEQTCWSDEKGVACRNWVRAFYVWKKNYARFAALRAVPKESRYYGGRRKADNWRGTRKEDIGNVLG